jgi:hypothetical protein
MGGFFGRKITGWMEDRPLALVYRHRFLHVSDLRTAVLHVMEYVEEGMENRAHHHLQADPILGDALHVDNKGHAVDTVNTGQMVVNGEGQDHHRKNAEAEGEDGLKMRRMMTDEEDLQMMIMMMKSMTDFEASRWQMLMMSYFLVCVVMSKKEVVAVNQSLMVKVSKMWEVAERTFASVWMEVRLIPHLQMMMEVAKPVGCVEKADMMH